MTSEEEVLDILLDHIDTDGNANSTGEVAAAKAIMTWHRTEMLKMVPEEKEIKILPGYRGASQDCKGIGFNTCRDEMIRNIKGEETDG